MYYSYFTVLGLNIDICHFPIQISSNDDPIDRLAPPKIETCTIGSHYSGANHTGPYQARRNAGDPSSFLRPHPSKLFTNLAQDPLNQWAEPQRPEACSG